MEMNTTMPVNDLKQSVQDSLAIYNDRNIAPQDSMSLDLESVDNHIKVADRIITDLKRHSTGLQDFDDSQMKTRITTHLGANVPEFQKVGGLKTLTGREKIADFVSRDLAVFKPGTFTPAVRR
tara:strand:+ start:78 stop:446 length:369 start_codon:yes stop_codon:yes gene_type:complete